jgi:hypothetical protein
MFTFGEVFGGLRVAAVLRREQIRNVYQLFFVEILGRTHHCLLSVATSEIGLNVL